MRQFQFIPPQLSRIVIVWVGSLLSANTKSPLLTENYTNLCRGLHLAKRRTCGVACLLYLIRGKISVCGKNGSAPPRGCDGQKAATGATDVAAASLILSDHRHHGKMPSIALSQPTTVCYNMVPTLPTPLPNPCPLLLPVSFPRHPTLVYNTKLARQDRNDYLINCFSPRAVTPT